jgi:glycosyltransferase involved in cell wall biosynthesis
MKHLLVSREYPPAPYSMGGIGTYVERLSHLLAAHGETVHVIAQQWPAAPRARESRVDGRLIVHRVPLDRPLPLASVPAAPASAVLSLFRDSALPSQAFLWQAALLAEALIRTEDIDIIEAQDYEAPSYFLQLRRAFGAPGTRAVPIVVHLHSPTEFVFAHNAWDHRRADYPMLTRFEGGAIRSADALLCPSRFLADIAAAHYQVDRRSIAVIPYPMDDAAVVDRTAETWRSGTICYVGRLEPRKGVSEWIDAAVRAAARHPSARFTLIGGDSSESGDASRSMREALLARIPSAMRPRFRFAGPVPRHELGAYLAEARLAVVPSRWENFPYSCIEAMSSGLPVLVSPAGGMAEMIEDGRTGWIASAPDADALDAALERALASPPAILAEMGAAAAGAIRRLCDSEDIVRRQLEFRRGVVARGCRPSVEMAAVLDASGESTNSAEALKDLLVRFPDLAASADDIAVLRRASLQRAGEGAAGPKAPSQGEQTMTLIDFLRAPPGQQLAVIRRALKDPGYVVRWLSWHLRRP